jgi:hypothetical protein
MGHTRMPSEHLGCGFGGRSKSTMSHHAENDGDSFAILAPSHIVKKVFDLTGRLPSLMIDALAV